MAKRRGIKVVRQRKDWDCGVACLTMLLNVPYGDVAAVVRELVDSRLLRRRGMSNADVQAVAERFGLRLELRWRSRDFLLGQTGILGLKGGKMDAAGHWVILKSGTASLVIVDPDGGESWDAIEYMAKHKARPTVLLAEAR